MGLKIFIEKIYLYQKWASWACCHRIKLISYRGPVASCQSFNHLKKRTQSLYEINEMILYPIVSSEIFKLVCCFISARHTLVKSLCKILND